jgi:phosphonoacetaldehyde hydrolase
MSKKIQAVIFDWAGTTVDYGCTGPLKVIIELFKLKDIEITVEEAKKPMGLLKINHLRELLKMERIRKAYLDRYGHEANEETVNEFYQLFEKLIFVELTKPTEALPGVLEAVSKLRADGIRIGSTSGYTKEMMAIVAPLAERVGYKPDFWVSSTEVPNGRPCPWMIFQNAMHFGLYDFSRFVKVGDTTVDIQEGRSANAWSVGVVEGSSMISLTKEDFDNLSADEQLRLKKSARKDLMNAGADFVIDTMHELPDLIEKINKKLEFGELPGGRLQVPKQPYLLFTPGNLSLTALISQNTTIT